MNTYIFILLFGLFAFLYGVYNKSKRNIETIEFFAYIGVILFLCGFWSLVYYAITHISL